MMKANDFQRNAGAEYYTIQCRNRENINKSRKKKNNYIE